MNDTDEPTEALVEEALKYAEHVIETGVAGLDMEKFGLLRTFAMNSFNYLDQMRRTRVEKTEIESDLIKAEDKIKSLEAQIEEYRSKESMHAGMCSAFQTAIHAMSQGYATGGKK